MGGNSSSHRYHAIQVEDTGETNESPVYRHILTATENGNKLFSTFRALPDADDLYKLSKSASIKYGNKNCLGSRPLNRHGLYEDYKWTSFKDFFDESELVALGLNEYHASKGDHVAILSPNTPEWLITAFGCYNSSLVVVPLNDYTSNETAKYIFNNSDIDIAFVHIDKWDIFEAIIDNIDSLKLIVVYGKTVPNISSSVPILTYSELIEKGRHSNAVLIRPTKDDIATILYTSGTLDQSKGCILTHENLLSGSVGLTCLGASVTTSDVYISYLPLAHIYETVVIFVMLAHGASIGFSPSADIAADVQLLRPTIICGVPRLWNRFYSLWKGQIESSNVFKRTLFDLAIQLKSYSLSKGQNTSLLADVTILSRFRTMLGGRVRLLVSGGAPLLPEVLDFLRLAVTPNIVQGYGLTEVSGCVSIQEVPSDMALSVGTVGLCTEIKLRSVPGMQFNPRGFPATGEIMVRGPNVFKGYYKGETASEWYATGDVAMISSDGHIQLIDRVGGYVKLSIGEYISVEKVADAISTSDVVKNVFVYANSHFDSPVAVVIPSDKKIAQWRSRGITDISKSETAASDMLSLLQSELRSKNFQVFETVGSVILDTEEFTIENGLLTHTMKPCIPMLKKKYEHRIFELLADK